MRLICTSILLAFTFTVSAIDLGYSGYAYQTVSQNSNLASSNNRLALNLTAQSGLWLATSQLSTHDLGVVQRAALGRTFLYDEGGMLQVDVGRVNKIPGFSDSVVDSPASSGMALLPMGIYDPRFINPLNVVDGIKLTYNKSLGDSAFEGMFAWGKPEMSTQKDLQQVLLGSTAMVPFIEIVPEYKSWGTMGKLTVANDITLFVSHDEYYTHWERLSTGNVLEEMVIAPVAASMPTLFVNRAGVAFMPTSKIEVKGEYATTTFSNSAINGAGYYLMADYSFGNGIIGYMGYSQNKSDVEGKWYNRDTYVGVSKDYQNMFVILEAHDATGTSFSESREDEAGILFTVGYRF